MKITPEIVADIARDICEPRTPDLADFDRPLLDLGLDSLDYASLLMALEEKYEIQFSNDDMETLNTVNKIAAAIDARAKN